MPLIAVDTSAAFGTDRRNIFDLSVESDNWAGYETPQRMSAKLKAIPLPFMLGRRVLDVGCDAGFFSFLAAERGASEVVGLDRNRHVKGVGYVDLVALNRKRAEDEGHRNVRFEHTMSASNGMRSARYLGSIERGTVSASVTVLGQLARALRVDPCGLIRVPSRR